MNYTIPVILLIIVLVGGAAFFYWQYYYEPAPEAMPGDEVAEPMPDSAGLANPASVYCEDEMAGGLVMYQGEAGQSGYCRLPETGELCEEWALFNSAGENCVAPTDDLMPVMVQ